MTLIIRQFLGFMIAVKIFLAAISKNLNLEPILAKAKERERQEAQALTQSQREKIADRLDATADRIQGIVFAEKAVQLRVLVGFGVATTVLIAPNETT